MDTVECKINPDQVNASVVGAFRDLYPEGRNFVVSPKVKKHYKIRRQDHAFTVCDTQDLSNLLESSKEVAGSPQA